MQHGGCYGNSRYKCTEQNIKRHCDSQKSYREQKAEAKISARLKYPSPAMSSTSVTALVLGTRVVASIGSTRRSLDYCNPIRDNARCWWYGNNSDFVSGHYCFGFCYFGSGRYFCHNAGRYCYAHTEQALHLPQVL